MKRERGLVQPQNRAFRLLKEAISSSTSYHVSPVDLFVITRNMPVAPDTSIVVVVRNEEKNIAKCLDSLIAQDFPRDKYEIIVVDGASGDKTGEICQGYPIRLIRLDHGGISYQRNVGVEAANAPYIAFTDADCLAEKDMAERRRGGELNSVADNSIDIAPLAHEEE